MIPTHKLHERFRKYWKPEYRHEDLNKVCASVLRLMGKPTKDCINAVKGQWSNVCYFLIQWEGKKL